MIVRCPFCGFDFTPASLPATCPECKKVVGAEELAPAPVAPVEKTGIAGIASAPPPVASVSSGGAAGQASHSSKIAEVMRIVAEFLGVVPKVIGGPLVSAGSFLASEALEYVADAVETKGSQNADTEAQAEQAVKDILSRLADLGSPLPAPEQVEAGAGSSGN